MFTPGHFFDLGTPSSVRMALRSLTQKGTIRRLAQGLYDYPVKHPNMGEHFPGPEQIAEALAARDGLRLQPSGAYAANLLGLSTQVPAKAIFLTDGSNRHVKVGNQEVILKRTTPKNMATAGRISGLVIQALRYLGKDHVDEKVVSQLAQVLTDEDLRVLSRDIRHAPGWIAEIIRKLTVENGKK